MTLVWATTVWLALAAVLLLLANVLQLRPQLAPVTRFPLVTVLNTAGGAVLVTGLGCLIALGMSA